MKPLSPAIVALILGAAAILFSWAMTGLVLRLFTNVRHRTEPNERSMHEVPTSNVGGLAIVATVLGLGALLILPTTASLILAGCVGGLALVSLIDHYRPLWPLSRLLFQALAVGAALSLLPHDLRLAPDLPFEVERAALGVAWLWMINLTNFIDGIDGIAATGCAATCLGYLAVLLWPPGAIQGTGAIQETGALSGMTGLGIVGDLPISALIAVLLAGACLGYLVWNWHPARIFMGDTGSIPLGFLVGWLMLDLALRGHWVSALILPAVFVTDATLTLLKRLMRAEKIWRPHRSHFYQRAVQGGTSPASVVRRMLIADAMLIVLAVLAKAEPGIAAVGALATVTLLLVHWATLAARHTPAPPV